MERWVCVCAAENGSLFCPSDFAIILYFFEKVVLISGACFIFVLGLRIGCKNRLNLYLSLLIREQNRKFGFDMSCKYGSSVVLLSDGIQNFQLHIPTQNF